MKAVVLQSATSGAKVRLPLDDPRAMHGGEAVVYPHPDDLRYVVKLYHQPREQATKLHRMVAAPPQDPGAAAGHISIAWPTDVLHEPGIPERVCGFVMPAIRGETMEPHEVYSPAGRKAAAPLVDHHFLHQVAANFCAAASAVHDRGHIIGDVNQKNLLVHPDSRVTLLDTDSFQIRDPESGLVHRCEVGVPEFQAPEMHELGWSHTERRVEHDSFGIGVLVFYLLMEGNHPFQCRRPPSDSGGGTLDENIRQGLFPYAGHLPSGYGPPPSAPPFDVLSPELRNLFVRCFVEGHRDPSRRPSAHEWCEALERAIATLGRCTRNDQHVYGSHRKSCPWCERSERHGIDAFPSKEAIRRGEHQKPRTPPRTQKSLKPAWGKGAPIHPPAPRLAPAVRPRPVPVPAPAPLATAGAPGAPSPFAHSPAPAPAAPPLRRPRRWKEGGVALLELPLFFLFSGVLWSLMGAGLGSLYGALWADTFSLENHAIRGGLVFAAASIPVAVRSWRTSWIPVREWWYASRAAHLTHCRRRWWPQANASANEWGWYLLCTLRVAGESVWEVTRGVGEGLVSGVVRLVLAISRSLRDLVLMMLGGGLALGGMGLGAGLLFALILQVSGAAVAWVDTVMLWLMVGLVAGAFCGACAWLGEFFKRS